MKKNDFLTTYYTITYKMLVLNGLHLGGNIQNFDFSNSSVIYGIRTNNLIINLTLSSFELLKSIKVFERFGRRRRRVFYVYANLSSQSFFKRCFNYYNLHLVRFSSKTNIIRKLFWRTIFIVGKWFPGFLTNRDTYRVYHVRLKRRLRLNLHNLPIKNKYYFDRFPKRPSGGIVINTKKSILNEFISLGIPLFYTGDVFLNNNNMLFYKIPSNSGTFELGNFFFIIFFSSYLLGFYAYLKKFHARYFVSLLNVKIYGKNIVLKKHLFFKRYILVNKIFLL
jgi:ribosomal protein S2